MIAVIVAGGKGTRLGLTKTPKCMVNLNGMPLIERQISTLKENGISKFYILTGYLSDVIKGYLGDGKKFDVEINYITETEPLGTAGCIKQLQGIIKSRFLVVYGDILFDIDLKRLLKFDRKTNGTATLVAHPNSHPYDSDLLEIDKNNAVVKVYSKAQTSPKYCRNLVNSGIYIFSSEIFNAIPNKKPADIGTHVLPNLSRLYAYVTPEYIKDIGTPTRLAQAKADLKSGKVHRLNIKNKRKAVFLDRDGVINKFVPDIFSIRDFELIPGVAEAIHKINSSECLTVVVTNQPAIAKGRMTEATMQHMHNKMDSLLGEKNAYIDALYYCPHHPNKGFKGEVASLKIKCNCRKPKPGMILQAARDLNIDLKNSWVIGDSYRDVQAGIKAGCKTIAIGSILPGAKYVAKNLLDTIKHISGVLS